MKKGVILILILLGVIVSYSNFVSATSVVKMGIINGTSANGMLGYAVASGDINGDGYKDLITSAYSVPSGDEEGRIYVFFGNSNGIEDMNDTHANITINGTVDIRSLGYSLASCDFNNDGYEDIISGSKEAKTPAGTYTGQIFVFFGENVNTPINEVAQDYANLTINGTAGSDYFGYSVTCDDLNNDGYGDIIAGAQLNGRYSNSGQIYVLLGENYTTTINENSAEAFANITINANEVNGYLGYSLATGDVNGDSYKDVIAGAYYTQPTSVPQCGQTFVFFGENYTAITNAYASSYANITLNYTELNSWFGFTVGGGDINNDSYADIMVHAFQTDPTDVNNAGQTFVFFGTNYITVINENVTESLPNITLNGTIEDGALGVGITNEDFNKDGYNDMILGEAYGSSDNNGRVYVFYGTSNYPSPVNENASTYANITINGTSGMSRFGWFLTTGDVNSDTYPEIIIGAYEASPPGLSGAGQVFVYSYEVTTTITAPTTPTITEPDDTTVGIKDSITYKCETSSTTVTKWTWSIERPDGTTLTKTGGSETTDTITFSGDDDNVAGTYTVKCEVENSAGKATSTNKNFQAFYSTTTSGGGGGGGGGIVFDEGETQERKLITTFILGGIIHKITIVQVDEEEGTVTIEIQSEPIIVILKIGETKEVDVNGDGISDISIKLNSITNGVADITTKELLEKEELIEIPIEEHKQIPGQTIEEEKPTSNLPIILIIGILGIIAVAYIIIRKKKRKNN